MGQKINCERINKRVFLCINNHSPASTPVLNLNTVPVRGQTLLSLAHSGRTMTPLG